ncbi:hypothetical protein PIIN_07505 [Serendipita indica DSM 11827]|uniref:Uncharacterized protein n=1 Tax=Serendipita indica (strain DSM 11827) TaxID=1109443 RepID=G4TQF9_SERID|nr:hypothetical protein PIIN_07505 [Serendipita indica DSM 11827]
MARGQSLIIRLGCSHWAMVTLRRLLGYDVEAIIVLAKNNTYFSLLYAFQDLELTLRDENQIQRILWLDVDPIMTSVVQHSWQIDRYEPYMTTKLRHADISYFHSHQDERRLGSVLYTTADIYQTDLVTGFSGSSLYTAQMQLFHNSHLQTLSLEGTPYVTQEEPPFLLPHLRGLYLEVVPFTVGTYFLCCLTAPNLRYLILKGECKSMCDIIQNFPVRLCLDEARIVTRPTQRLNYKDILPGLQHSHEHSIRKLVVVHMPPSTSQGRTLQTLCAPLQTLLSVATVQYIHIYFRSLSWYTLSELDVLKRPITKLEPTSWDILETIKPSWQQTVVRSALFACDTLSLVGKVDYPLATLPCIRRLYIGKSVFGSLYIPTGWVSSLEEIEDHATKEPTIVLPFPTSPDDMSSEESNVTNSHAIGSQDLIFGSLFRLHCKLKSAMGFLGSVYTFPALREVILITSTPQTPESGGMVLELLHSRLHSLPQLRTIGLGWFPVWNIVERILKEWVQVNDSSIVLTLRLPKRPARRLVGSLVRLLNGDELEASLNHLEGPQIVLPCEQCTLAGWLSPGVCNTRHGVVDVEELFSLTKYTEY